MAKKILLMDMYSTIHVGNGALLENTIKLCDEAFGKSEFYITTLDKETNAKRYDKNRLYNSMFGNFWYGKNKIGQIFWLFSQLLFMSIHVINEKTFKIKSSKLAFTKDHKKAIEIIENSDICVSSAGEAISDTQHKALAFWLFTYWFSIKKGKKFILFPQSIGPLHKGWTRKLVYKALKDADLYVGRDKPSYDTLVSLGFDKAKIMYVPDVAIQQEVGKADIHHYFKNADKKVVGVTISNPPFHEMGSKYINFVEVIGAQIEQLNPALYKVLIMPSNFKLKEKSPDYKLCLQLQERLQDKFEVGLLEDRAYFPGEYTGLLSQLEFFISTRMHVAIMATTAFTPTIAINTQHKIRGYMNNIEMGQFCVDYSDLNQIFDLSQEIVKDRAKIVTHLQNANTKLKEEHKEFVNRLKELA